MSKLTKEALDSTDADFIKKARGVEKGRVTRCVDQILTVLKLDESNSYDHKSISRIEVGEAEITLKEAFTNVVDLHSRYQVHRAVGTDAAEEEALENGENDYIVAVETKYHEGQKSINNYNQVGEMNHKEYLVVNEKFPAKMTN